jgi:hypothetical protein
MDQIDVDFDASFCLSTEGAEATIVPVHLDDVTDAEMA